MILTIIFVISCFLFMWTTGVFIYKMVNKGIYIDRTHMACSISFTYIMWYIFTGVGIA